MSDDNKEGAGVPVAWLHYAAKKPQLRRVDFSPTPSTLEKASGWLSIALGPVATPPAVMPAASSDALEKAARETAKWLNSYFRFHDGNLYADRLTAALSQTMQPQPAAGEQAGANPWRAAIDEALIVNCLDSIRPDETPETALARLVQWEVQVALDPAVSGAAVNLIEQGKALAAPGAAIAAREQEGPGEVTDAQIEQVWFNVEGTRRGYIPFARAVLALTQPTTVQQAEKGGA